MACWKWHSWHDMTSSCLLFPLWPPIRNTSSHWFCFWLPHTLPGTWYLPSCNPQQFHCLPLFETISLYRCHAQNVPFPHHRTEPIYVFVYCTLAYIELNQSILCFSIPLLSWFFVPVECLNFSSSERGCSNKSANCTVQFYNFLILLVTSIALVLCFHAITMSIIFRQVFHLQGKQNKNDFTEYHGL